jgi:hypothetical protein
MDKFADVCQQLLLTGKGSTRTVCGVTVYRRHGRPRGGTGGFSVRLDAVLKHYTRETDAARAILAGHHVEPRDGRCW